MIASAATVTPASAAAAGRWATTWPVIQPTAAATRGAAAAPATIKITEITVLRRSIRQAVAIMFHEPVSTSFTPSPLGLVAACGGTGVGEPVGLQPEQLRVASAGGQQLLVAALLGDVAVLEHHDQVRVPHG